MELDSKGVSRVTPSIPSEVTYLTNLLAAKMKDLGMRSGDIDKITTHLRMACNHQSGLRNQVTLNHLGTSSKEQLSISCSKHNTASERNDRWVPDVLDDLLWNHTFQKIRTYAYEIRSLSPSDQQSAVQATGKHHYLFAWPEVYP